MKIKFIAVKIILLVLFSIDVSSQNIDQAIKNNLQKYWNYRDRLRKYFVVIDPNDRQGTNIPAARIVNNSKLYYGDGNGTHNYYIGMLATEYALLKQTGNDYTQTRNELLYALKAVDRLDMNAEKYFRSDGSVLPSDKNGFMLRMDVPDCQTFRSIFSQIGNYAEFLSGINETESTLGKGSGDIDFIASKDVCWNFLLNLALVKALVDDYDIVKKARDIAYRMVNMMHHTNQLGQTGWLIKNPVTGHLIPGDGRGKIDELVVNPAIGSESAMDGLRYGFSVAADWITGNLEGNLEYPGTWVQPLIYSKEHYKNLFYYNMSHMHVFYGTTIDYCIPLVYAEPYGFFCNTITFDFSYYSYFALGTIIGNDLDFKHYNPEYTSIFDFLNAYKHVNEGGRTFEHFPLIYELLHGPKWNSSSSFDPLSQLEIDYYLNLLNSAQECGPDDLSPICDNLFSTTDNRLVWPNTCENKNGTLWGNEQFNGLDYMLLHNLFWLVYIQKYGFSKRSSGVYPYPYDQYPKYTYSEPYENSYGYEIVETSKVSSGGGLIDRAGVKIILKPGFYVNHDGYFRGYLSGNNWYNYPEYSIYTPASCPLRDGSITKSAQLDEDLAAENKSSAKKEKIDLSQIILYPNPVNDKLFIEGITNYNAEVYDITGKLILNCKSSQNFIDFKNIKPGVYTIHLKGQGKTSICKIVKQK